MPKTVSTEEFLVDQLCLADPTSPSDRAMNEIIAEEMCRSLLMAGHDVNAIYQIAKDRPRAMTTLAARLRRTGRLLAADPVLQSRAIRAEYRRHPLEIS